MSRGNHVVMNWDCQRQGCFNRKKRLKFGAFTGCLPGRISFTDVDGLVEVNGNLLLMEWKDHPALSTGQRILFERMTLVCPATVLVVEGDAEDMTVRSIRIVWRGRISPSEPADLEGLRELIRAWSQWAVTHSALRRARTASWN